MGHKEANKAIGIRRLRQRVYPEFDVRVHKGRHLKIRYAGARAREDNERVLLVFSFPQRGPNIAGAFTNLIGTFSGMVAVKEWRSLTGASANY